MKKRLSSNSDNYACRNGIALEVLSLKAKMTGSKNLTNAEIVRTGVEFSLESEIDIRDCKDENDVFAAIKMSIPVNNI